MSVFICPVCGKRLNRDGTALKCALGHSFDLAAQGYVNLMPSGRARANAGDSAQMMASRRRFLSGGYYACLRDTLASMAARTVGEGTCGDPVIIDAGCGEGYYTSALAKSLKVPGARVAGVDISKHGVKAAAKLGADVEFAVASIFDLPFESGGADLVVSVFAPVCDREFARVLKPGGSLIVAAPGRDHLLGLKRAVYDRPYLNDEKRLESEYFSFAEEVRARNEITVKGGLIGDLFTMTPYFWNTPSEDAEKLRKLDTLTTPVDFIVTRYVKLTSEKSE